MAVLMQLEDLPPKLGYLELAATEVQTPASTTTSKTESPTTLAGYLQQDRASPSAFFKVLRKNKVRRFQPDDQEAAGRLMTVFDPDGKRLWALMSQSSLPEAMDAWLWGAAETCLKEKLGEAFNPQDYDESRILSAILTRLLPELRSEDKEERGRAQTWLRIGVCWLLEKRALKAWKTAEGLRPVLFSESKKAERLVRRAIQKGKTSELRLAVAVVELGDQMVRELAKERDGEKNKVSSLRQSLDDARKAVENLNSELEGARRTLAEHKAAISKLEQTLATERQHSGHDLTEARAKQKILLGERLGPLLEDARDALEIDSPSLGIALGRIKSALDVIKEANE